MADTFAAHKTLGELILIDRVTNMTSACGVVTELHADEDGLEEKKVNKKLRSAFKRSECSNRGIPGWKERNYT